MVMRASLTLVLAPLLAFAGCVETADGPEAASLESGAVGSLPCELAEATLLEWAAEDGPMQVASSETFDLAPGSRDLHVGWSEPTAAAGDIELRLLAPDESVVFERVVAGGVSAAGSSVTIFGVSQNPPIDNPQPLAGTYTFEISADGAMPGAALVVTAMACAAAQTP